MSRLLDPGRLRGGDRQGDAGARPFDLSWIGRSTGRAERRQVVVLAIGFEPTRVTDPEELASTRARRRDFVHDIVRRFGGRVGRVDPDLQIAAWGWPAAGEADTRLAVAAALEIAQEDGYGARCGLDAGIAITSDAQTGTGGLGFVGEMIAAAVAQLAGAKRSEVLVSAAVRRLVSGAYEFERRDLCSAEAPVWRISLKDPVAYSRQLKQEADKPLAGRQTEQAELSLLWHGTVDGHANFVCIEGGVGFGKTALLSWLGRAATESAGRFIVVKCGPEAAHMPLQPVRTLLELLSDLDPPPPGAPEAAELLAECRKELAPPQVDVAALRRALCRLIAHAALSGPLVIAIEDLQWADGSTERLLAGLAELARMRASVMVVATLRSGGAQSDRAWLVAPWRRLRLRQLGLADIERVVADSEHGDRLSPEACRRIAERADGVPLFACELARLTAEHSDEEAHHRLLARPNRLNGELTNRLDALETLKPLAQAAAVTGRIFDTRVLAAALDMEERVLIERLEMLAGMGIVARRRHYNATQFRFRDALLWSQAYGSVPKSRRARLHHKIAGLLEGELGVLVDPPAAEVAHHWKKCGKPGKAFGWWFRAAMEAAEDGAAVSSVAYIKQAIAAKELFPDACSARDEATLLSVLGAQLRALQGAASSETVAAYERALEVVSGMSSRAGDLDLEIAWGLAAIHLVRGDVRAAAEASSKLVHEATERGRDDLVLLGLRAHGTARLLIGFVAEAAATFADVASRYDRRRHGELHKRYVSDPGAVARAHLASALALAGDRDAWLDARRQAMLSAEAVGHVHTTANVLAVLSLSAMHLGDRATATSLARAVLHIACERGYAYWQARGRLILAWDAGMRQPERGLVLIRQALEDYRKTGAGRAMVFAGCLAADVAINAGRPRQALELLAPVQDTGERLGEWLYIPEVKRLEAIALSMIEPENANRARALLDEAEAMALCHGSAAFVARIAAAKDRIEAPKRRRPGPGRRSSPPRERKEDVLA